MAKVELIMPKLGESIMEATILKWVKKVGDTIEMDETILEIATDKVDSEVPSPIAGTLIEILFQEDDVVEIGKAIAIIATEGESVEAKPSSSTQQTPSSNGQSAKKESVQKAAPAVSVATTAIAEKPKTKSTEARFYSPLVKNIAQKENLSQTELDNIPGTGQNNRLTKKDILVYLSNRGTIKQTPVSISAPVSSSSSKVTSSVGIGENVEIVEMDRMRRLIADHMVRSKATSPHVTSFVEVDVTNMVNWRNRVKKEFQAKYNQKITFTPLFVDAVVKGLKDFPLVNVSVDGSNIIVKKDINIGMAAALPSGNLIVPVIKNADTMNLLGLTKTVNDLANRARTNKLKPNDIQGGTFTLTNVGTFGNVMGTPIINQPQAAILAAGAIRKKPAVLETEYGDVIAIRQMMFLSLSYDHRIVDGFLGGSFLRKVADYLEAFDDTQTV